MRGRPKQEVGVVHHVFWDSEVPMAAPGSLLVPRAADDGMMCLSAPGQRSLFRFHGKGKQRGAATNCPGLTCKGGCFVWQVVWSQCSGEAVIEGVTTSFALGPVDERRGVKEQLIFGGMLVKAWPGHGCPSRYPRRH